MLRDVTPDPPLPIGQIESWIEAARDGSLEAAAALFDAFEPYLTILADDRIGTSLGAKAGVSDIVQETLLTAHARFPEFRGRTEGELRAWLAAILNSRAADQLRRFCSGQMRSVDREVPLQGPDSQSSLAATLAVDTPLPIDRLSAMEEAEALEAAFARLSQRDRLVIDLRNRQGRSFDEIARVLGVSFDAARMQWARAIQRLKSQFVAPT